MFSCNGFSTTSHKLTYTGNCQGPSALLLPASFHTNRQDSAGFAELDNSIFEREINHSVNSSKPPNGQTLPDKYISETEAEPSWNLLSLLSTFTTDIPPPLRSCASATRQSGVCKSNRPTRFLSNSPSLVLSGALPRSYRTSPEPESPFL